MEYFPAAVIQDRIKDFFVHSIEHERLAHAFIFYGEEGRGKEAFALELAKALNCEAEDRRPCNQCASCTKINHLNHPDVKVLFPVTSRTKATELKELFRAKAENPYSPTDVVGHKNIAIEKIRELKREATYAPFEARKRFFIIAGAEYMAREASNSFLKLLEEPPENLIIILITRDYHNLLDTIRSRCQSVYFPEFSGQQMKEIINRYQTVDQDLDVLIRISRFNLKKVYRLLHSAYQQQREVVYEFLKALASGNMFLTAQIIDRITQKRDKNYILEILDLLVLWLQDALHVQILGTKAQLLNLDFEEAIAKFSDYYLGADLRKIIERVEEAARQITMNGHPALTLTSLAIDMHEKLTIQPTSKEAV